MNTSQNLLEVSGLRVEVAGPQGSISIVRNVDLAVGPGEALVLLGESGSGKSMTLKALMGLTPGGSTVSGSVRIAGRELVGMSSKELQRVRGKIVSLIPQDASASLDPLRKIGQQIREVLLIHGEAHTRAQADSRALELLDLVGLRDPRRVLGSFPHQLSGGMRQRSAIALAVACRPQVLLADEATSALDATTQAQVLELFRTLREETGVALVLVTHDIGVAAEAGNQVAVMYAGRVLESAATLSLLERPGHPYTAGLLGAQPRPGVPAGSLVPIPGNAPAPQDVAEHGCAFAARCTLVQPDCRITTPALLQIRNGHYVACPVTTGNPILESAGASHE